MTDDFETWYAALDTQVLQRLFKSWPLVDRDPFYVVRFGHLGFCMG